MKKLFSLMITISILVLAYTYKEDIMKLIVKNFIAKNINTQEKNEYYKDVNYEYVHQTDNFYPKNKQDLLNVFYTILNNGWDKFTFYCDLDYENCTSDVKDIVNDEDILSYIDNFVSPFNSYDNISLTTNNFGGVNIEISKLYSDEDIININKKIDQILKEIITNKMNDKEKIKAIHDYIINNSSYDQTFDKNSTNNTYPSNKATGTLLYGKSICSGYSDTMALFLDRLNIKNYKIISDDHVWNYVYLDKWYHLDLTWDDPITNNNRDVLLHNFFLISSNDLESLSKKMNTSNHNYNKNVYIEAK